MMRMIAFACTALAVTTLVGCGGSAPAPAPKAEAPKAAAPAAAPTTTPAAAPATAPTATSEAPAPEMKQPDTAVAPEVAAEGDEAMLQKIIGTTWSMPDGTELTFKDDKNVQAKGGKAAIAGANGMNVSYTFKDGNFEFSAMGTKLVGTWDGEKLTVAGGEGTKKAQ